MTAGAAEAKDGAVPPRKDKSPLEAPASRSSRNRSSGTWKAPWTPTMAEPATRAEIRRDPTEVRKRTKTVARTRPARVSRSEKVRSKITNGESDGRKR